MEIITGILLAVCLVQQIIISFLKKAFEKTTNDNIKIYESEIKRSKELIEKAEAFILLQDKNNKKAASSYEGLLNELNAIKDNPLVKNILDRVRDKAERQELCPCPKCSDNRKDIFLKDPTENNFGILSPEEIIQVLEYCVEKEMYELADVVKKFEEIRNKG